MTTLTIRYPHTTIVERLLLRLSAGIAGFVARRAEDRAVTAHDHAALRTRAAVEQSRRDLVALAHSGILPR